MTDTDNTYSIYVATIYVFNLIFGSGVLLLVYAFWNVGYAIGTVLFLFLAFLSLVTCTYIVEAMSIACALRKSSRTSYTLLPESDESENLVTTGDKENIVPVTDIEPGTETKEIEEDHAELFVIDHKFELVDMAHIFFNKWLLYFFFISTVIYLYGDLLVYLSVVGGSLKRITCTDFNNGNSPGLALCNKIGETNVLRIYITIFTLSIGSMAYFNVTKTKVIQFGTIALRWTAFFIMLILASIRIANHEPRDPHPADFSYLPVFIGTGLYSFMCQHSIPGVVFPIRQRKRSYLICFILAVVGSLLCYLALTTSGVLAFLGSEIQPVYTMNFMIVDKGIVYIILGSFLQLFPVIALSSSYPIIGITLRENIKNMTLTKLNPESKLYNVLYRFVIPTLIIFPPYIVILFVSDSVSTIVGIVGSYAGTLVQYVIPALLVFFARRKARTTLGEAKLSKNFHKSNFSHTAIVIGVLVWSVVGIALVTYFQINKFIKS